MTPQEQAAFVRALVQSAIDDLNVAIPARVTGVAASDKVNVVCDINRGRMVGDGSRVYDPTTEIESVPVALLSCGGYSFNLPVQAGCKGLLIFCDYDNDEWQEGNPNPHTARTHSLNDPFFFPVFNGAVIDGDNLEIKSPTTTLILGNGFDVRQGGRSLIDDINNAFSRCCRGMTPLDGWKP